MRKHWIVLFVCMSWITCSARAGSLSGSTQGNLLPDAATCQVNITVGNLDSPGMTDLGIQLNHTVIYELVNGNIFTPGDPVQTYDQGTEVTLRVVRNYSEFGHSYKVYFNNVQTGILTEDHPVLSYPLDTYQSEIHIHIQIEVQ
ncbi:MAG: hypothetical protein LUF85_11150 [Bacteroides sp.]|nr:hypothetical protein [Bacteroides sp.]